METVEISYDRLRYLEGVEREARRLVMFGLKCVGNPPQLVVIEEPDHMDPHWQLCTLLDAQKSLNPKVTS